MARRPTSVTVTASGNTVTVMWSISSSGDDVTGYLVYYHHPNHDTTITTISSPNVYLQTFAEHSTQYVYAVSVQALSKHLSSKVIGPVTVRGQLSDVLCKVLLTTYNSVPGPVQNQLVEIVMGDRLSISWERPAQPNDYTLNYTVSVTDISTGTELRAVLNETHIIVTFHHTPCVYIHMYIYLTPTSYKFCDIIQRYIFP